jgi:hypothetical protein
MHGRGVNRAVGGMVVLLLAVAPGCDDARPQPPAAAPESGDLFDKGSTGEVTGSVVWKGALPSVQPLVGRPGLVAAGFDDEQAHAPNPNAPHIDGETRAVRGAVVFLRGIDPRHGRPWDLPPVRVVQRAGQFHVRQGDADGAVGFVRRGDAVEMVSADPRFYSLHAGGAAFFTLAFPDPDRPRTRRLASRGVVELTSAAGAFWMRGYLFVDDHPYYTRTDNEGLFQLKGVPPGRYEVVCWLPDWREASRELDAETAHICRLTFRPPLEVVQPVQIAPRRARTVAFELDAERFGP